MVIDEPPDPVWDGMPRADFLRFAAAIRWSADQMNLRDWRLQLRWNPTDDDDDCHARIDVNVQLTSASITVEKDFAALPEDLQRKVICHELIHVHMEPLTHIGDMSVRSFMGEASHRMLAEEMHRAIEIATEQMAMAWAPHLDEIPEELTPEDDVYIRLQDGKEVQIGEYLNPAKET